MLVHCNVPPSSSFYTTQEQVNKFAVRTRYLDDQLLKCTHLSQAVVLGVGCDTRAYHSVFSSVSLKCYKTLMYGWNVWVFGWVGVDVGDFCWCGCV